MSVPEEILARVAAAVPGRQVEDALVVDSPDPTGHVVVYCTDGSFERSAIGEGVPQSAWVDVTIHSFGPDRWAAEWLSTRITDDLMGAPIDADGWQVSWLSEHHRTGGDPDTDVPGRPTVLIIDQFRGQFTKAT